MKRVFQWERYLEWKSLSSQEKLAAKRFLFLPLLAYLIIMFIDRYAFAIAIFFVGYLAYKKFEKGKLKK